MNNPTLKPVIAIVDDETDILENFESLLSTLYTVQTFSSAAQFLAGLDDLWKKGLRLVISDFRMPQMTGLEMIRQAHNIKPFPFIILSGHLDKQTVMGAVDLGVFRLFEKPARIDDLLIAIDNLLLESELTEVRKEIRSITSQLREFYSSIRIALLQHIPEETLQGLIVDAPGGNVKEKMSFEDLLEKLEHRLETLLASESLINKLRNTTQSKNQPVSSRTSGL